MIKFVTVLLIISSSTFAKVILSKDSQENHVNSIINEIQNKIKTKIDLPTINPPIKEKEEQEDCLHSNDVDGDLHKCEETPKVDNGTALILTPYIENEQYEEARNASRVDPSLFLGFESYSGFFTVNKTYDSNTFFWYFPIHKKSVSENPWIIWLQGGPGASSLAGLFDEIGPITFGKDGVMIKNQYSWVRNHSLLFIDNPVGTGYSFTNHQDGFVSDMATYSKHLLSAVEQFLKIFPELKTAPLFVAGESYAGKYVPALGMALHQAKNSGLEVNLQGFMIGNAYVDPSMLKNVHRPLFYFGLLSKEQLGMMEPIIKEFQDNIDNNRSVAAKNNWMQIVTVLLIFTHQTQAYNYLKDESLSGKAYTKLLQTSEVKRALHVGDIKYSFINVTVNSVMAKDFLSSSQKLFEELLENNYRVLNYCGHLDLLLPCPCTTDNLRTWQWPGREEFINSARHSFIFRNKLAGFFKTGGNVTEAMIRGAGHMVPVDQPARAQALVTNWTMGLPLYTRSSTFEILYLTSTLNSTSPFVV